MGHRIVFNPCFGLVPDIALSIGDPFGKDPMILSGRTGGGQKPQKDASSEAKKHWAE
jgi:hypothetical protein